MNIFNKKLSLTGGKGKGKGAASSGRIASSLASLTVASALLLNPSPAQGAVLLKVLAVSLTEGIIQAVDNNSCWANLLWGCDSNAGTEEKTQAGDGAASSTGAFSYMSDFPPASDPNGLVPEGGAGGGARDSIDSKPCTQGSTCPGDELGDVIVTKSTVVSPAYANSRTNTCPLYWVPGKEDSQSVISCKLISDSRSMDLGRDDTDQSGRNVSDIPVGKHVLSCARTTTETVTQYAAGAGGSAKAALKKQTNVFTTVQEQNVRCNPVPNINEF